MNISIIVSTCSVNGSMEWTLGFLKHLDYNRHEVIGIAINNVDYPLTKEIYYELSQYALVRQSREYCREISKKSDIVIAWWSIDLEDCLDPKPPLVMVSHHTPTETFDIKMMHQKRINEYVACSRLAYSAIPRDRRENALIIPYTLDFNKLSITKSRDVLLNELKIPHGKKILGFIGQFEEVTKDPTALADTLKHLPTDWVGLMVGGPLDDPTGIVGRCRKLAGERVYFAGYRRDLGNYHNIIDILLIPSRREAFCIVAIEAAYNKLPIIMTRTGINQDGDFAYRNIEFDSTGAAIADAVLEVYNNAHHSNKLQLSREYVLQNHSNEKFASSWENYLNYIEGKYGLVQK